MSGARSIRLATFNLLYQHAGDGPGSWTRRQPLARRAIEEARADLIGFQEVFPSALDALRKDLGAMTLIPGPTSGPPRWVDASYWGELVLRTIRTGRVPDRSLWFDRSERLVAGEHVPIAYRASRLRPLASGAFWISPDPDRPGSMPPLAPAPCLVHWARFERLDGPGRLLVLNAHFGHAPWHYDITARTVARKVGELDGASPAPSGAQAHEVFLLGDFNAWPSSPLLRTLTSPKGLGFVDAVLASPEHAGPPVTFQWGTGTRRLGVRLDYVLARGVWRPRRTEVIDVHEGRLYPSDHHPLVVEFETTTGRGASLPAVLP